MSEDFKAKLTAKKKSVEAEFNKLEEFKKQLVGQRSEIDKKLTGIWQRQTQLQGEYKGIEEIFKETIGDPENGFKTLESTGKKERKEVTKKVPKKK